MASNNAFSNFRHGHAGNASNNHSSIPCRFFMNGSCRDGPRCRFLHDRNGDRSTMNLCKFYLRGNCSYGESCKYEHVRPLNANHQRSSGSSEESGESSLHGSSRAEGKVNELSDLLKKTKLRVDAQEFVPACFSLFGDSATGDGSFAQNAEDILCPYHILGQCWYGDRCSFIHGIMCDLCDRPVLHPNDDQFNRKHREECIAEHERDMKAAFAVARGKEKQCGICMEVVLEKSNTSARRFGILPSCKHCFCLDCIRKWRQANQFEKKIIRACPECRTVSDFVAPSSVWVEEEDEKRSLINDYKSAMKEKKCKYFREGNVECPFGNKCFYRHVKPDGTVVQGDSPRAIRRRQRQQQRRENRNGAASDVYLLWEFLDETRSHIEADDWPWEFQLDDDLDWMSLTDSESEYYDY